MISLYIRVWVFMILHLCDICERKPSINHLNWRPLALMSVNHHINNCQTSFRVCWLLKPEVMVSVKDVYFSDAVGIPLQSIHVYGIWTEVALIVLTEQITQV